jgi:hypothetical protein
LQFKAQLVVVGMPPAPNAQATCTFLLEDLSIFFDQFVRQIY